MSSLTVGSSLSSSPLPSAASYRQVMGLGHVVFVDRSSFSVLRRPPLNLGPMPMPTPAELQIEARPTWDQMAFVRWLFEQAGLDLNQYGQQTLRRRIHACLRVLRVESCEQARRLLERRPSLIHSAISSLVIGVTSFFRDTPVFDYLRRHVRDNLAWRPSPVRIWSVGCADGSEMYSLAILVAEAGMLHRCELLGTDCRTDTIAKARSGLYDDNAVRGVEPWLLRRYFRPETEAGHRVVEPLRRAVQWRTADALNQNEPGQWNLILCRNMAMYFKPEVASNLWRKLEAALCPGGLLVLGKAERPGGTRLTMVAPCIYRRHG